MSVRQLGIPMIAGLLPGEMIVDLFAGGGGASHGIEMALGRSPDVAINHDPAAIQMHATNHPATRHLCENIYQVDPLAVTSGAPVGLLWASPDCRHFSKAKGKAPVSKAVRGLAWMILRWAGKTRPRVICMENVEEWLTWGPVRRGRPVRKHAGKTFAKWQAQLEALGYVVEHRLLRACDFDTPTTRRRLFLVARCDGRAIEWPEPSHGKTAGQPYRTAAECIDWSLPCPSIFGRKRPLAEKTMRRIAAGVVRYVLEAAEPFIVTCNHGGAGFRGQGLGEPMRTITGSHDAHGLVAPYLVPRYGEREGQDPRAMRADQPMPTIVPTGNGASLVAAFLAKHYGGVVGQGLDQPIGTVTGIDHHSVVGAHLARHPGLRAGDVAALLVQYYGSGSQWSDLREPLRTIVAKARHGLVTVTVGGEDFTIVDIGMRMLEPHELATAQGFPPEYILTGTKAQRIKRIGNSVCPRVARALVAANLVEPTRKPARQRKVAA